MVVLFAVTLFLSSSLLFVVQPMMAKMVLPLLGGSPAVWNTCMVFFQATLLAGYLYAHASTRWLRFQHQAIVHISLLTISFLALPIVLASHYAEPPATGTPVMWLLWMLLVTVGLPYFLVSSSGPLLQRWFTRTDHPSAADPYFLSVAGNAGSICALLAYPAVLEPLLRVREQSTVWTAGYVCLVLLTATCFFLVYTRSKATRDERPATSDQRPPTSDQRPTARQRSYWILLAFVPSSLLLGVTTFLTTDVAAVPLFWIVPLVIYLLTFVLVFARRTVLSHAAMVRALPLWVLPLAWLVAFNTNLPVVAQGPIHLLTFFFAAMVCHGELAQRRPSGQYLTEFYLCMSIGGVLGGIFNALLAPLMFSSVLEYPLVLVLACALRPAMKEESEPVLRRRLDFALPLVVGAFALAMMFLLDAAESKAPLTLLLVFILPTVVCFSFSRRPLRFALSVGALMMAAGTYAAAQEHVTHRGRSFFGVHRVYDMPEKNLRYLVHGGIIHGVQHLDVDRRREPVMYYDKNGPIGHLFNALPRRSEIKRIGVVGLGIGGLAAYSQAGQQWTFFEIDPTIADLARDSRQFTYLSDSPARMRIVLGDARIALTKEPDSAFDMLIVDAFSSDAIPVHLLTREALQLYWQKIDSQGVMAFHISNRYLELGPLVCALARDAGLLCLVRSDKDSDWAVMARSAAVLGPVTTDSRWHQVAAKPGSYTWTDDFSNPLSLVRWFGK
jgi:hypothetical protein